MLSVLFKRCPYSGGRFRLLRRELNSTLVNRDEVGCKRFPPQPHENFDQVSLPDPDSNIRCVVYSKAKDSHEEVLNSERYLTNQWNDEFWKEHNKTFFKEKKDFIEKSNAASGTGQEVSEKLSIFYKEFLERNHDIYMEYNREWYRRNFSLLWMSARNFFTRPFFKKKQVPSEDVIT